MVKLVSLSEPMTLILVVQAILFPLTVAARNFKAGDARREAAERLLQQMRAHSPELLDQAQIVSEELIRVAVLWSEMWNEALEEVRAGLLLAFLWSCLLWTRCDAAAFCTECITHYSFAAGLKVVFGK